MSTWYYAGAERQQLGPLSTDELKQYFHSERIALDTLVWRDGMLAWRPLAELAQQLGLVPPPALEEAFAPAPQAFTAGPPQPPMAAAENLPAPTSEPSREPARASAAPTTGRAVFNLGIDPSPTPAFVRADTGDRSAAFTPAGTEPATAAVANPYLAGRAPLRARSSSAPDPDVVYAGFWKRAAAAIIDGFILSLVVGLCAEALGAILGDLSGGGETAVLLLTLLCTILLNACYFAWFHSTLNFATPGKMAIGIKVVRGNGEPISFLRGFGRFFAAGLSSLILGLGYLMAAFTARKQSLHDMICDTVVVDKWAYTSQSGMQRHELGGVALTVLILYGVLLLIVFIAFMALGIGAMRQFG